MNALRRLFVALVGLCTAVVLLLIAITRLLAKGTLWMASHVPAPRALTREEVIRPANARAQRPRLALVPQDAGPRALTQAQRLESALVGLGYRAAEVRQYVGGVGPRVERERLEVLIKEGLGALSSKVAL